MAWTYSTTQRCHQEPKCPHVECSLCICCFTVLRWLLILQISHPESETDKRLSLRRPHLFIQEGTPSLVTSNCILIAQNYIKWSICVQRNKGDNCFYWTHCLPEQSGVLQKNIGAQHMPVAVVQLLSHVQLFVISWTAARQVSRSFTISQSLLRLMSIESVMPSNHLILCHPLLLLPSIFLSIGAWFPVSWLFASDGQSIGTSASASVLPMNMQDWFPVG